MNDFLQFVMVGLVFWSLFAFAGAYIAQAKGRPAFEGVVFGFILGPLGLLMTALLPTIRKPAEAVAEPVAAKPVVEPPTGPKPGIKATARDDYMADAIFEAMRRAETHPSPDSESGPTSRQLRTSGPSRGLRA